MTLHIINTGSAGNCYIFEAKDAVLIVECGVPFKDVKKALKFDLSKVVGCLVTHEHGDHFKYGSEFASFSVPIYASFGTHGNNKFKTIPTYSQRQIKASTAFICGPFYILPFDVKHDAAEPLGFLIQHPEMGNTLFLTDSMYSPYTFNNLNNIIIEANYCEDILDRKLAEGANGFVRDRVINSHMSIQTCEQLLLANELSAVNNIVLIHLSDSNSDAQAFQKRITSSTGKNVTVASKGMKMEWNLNPF